VQSHWTQLALLLWMLDRQLACAALERPDDYPDATLAAACCLMGPGRDAETQALRGTSRPPPSSIWGTEVTRTMPTG